MSLAAHETLGIDLVKAKNEPSLNNMIISSLISRLMNELEAELHTGNSIRLMNLNEPN